MKLCDLHTHSNFSDGSDTPAQIIRCAVDMGLSAVALCDHNTVYGLPDFMKAARGLPMEAIAGAEFSVDYNGKELHLLGLFIPEKAWEQLSAIMEDVLRRKEESNLALVESLGKAGYPLDYAAIKATTARGLVNRAHIAEELTRLGYTASIKEAFRTLLDAKAGHYKEPRRISVWEMLDTLKQLHAAPVLAHPFLNLNTEALVSFLPEAKKQGLLGIECYYSDYSRETTAEALALADSLQLLPSGGSDFHGKKKPHIHLGTGTGNLQIPYEWAVRIKEGIR